LPEINQSRPGQLLADKVAYFQADAHKTRPDLSVTCMPVGYDQQRLAREMNAGAAATDRC